MAFLGCAGTPARTPTAKETDPSLTANAGRSGVRAVLLDAQTSDGQTTWRIHPDSSLMPSTLTNKGDAPHIEQRLQYAFDLAQRGATYSAVTEFHTVLGLCALELDATAGSHVHRTALRQAMTALSEAEDFTKQPANKAQQIDATTIAKSHATQKHCESLYGTDSLSAVRAYYTFAEERLTFACGEMPLASVALYGLGRVVPLLDGDEALSTARALLYHRSALAVDESNMLAANELSVLLVHHGHLTDAARILQKAAAMGVPSPSITHNLAVVKERLGGTMPSRENPPVTTNLASRHPVVTDGQIDQRASSTETLTDLSVNEASFPTASNISTGITTALRTESREPLYERTAWDQVPVVESLFQQ